MSPCAGSQNATAPTEHSPYGAADDASCEQHTDGSHEGPAACLHCHASQAASNSIVSALLGRVAAGAWWEQFFDIGFLSVAFALLTLSTGSGLPCPIVVDNTTALAPFHDIVV